MPSLGTANENGPRATHSKGATTSDGKKAVDNWKKLRPIASPVRTHRAPLAHKSRRAQACSATHRHRRIRQGGSANMPRENSVRSQLRKVHRQRSTTGTIKNTATGEIPWMAAMRAAGHSIDAAHDAAMRSEDAWNQAWHETQLAAEAQKEQEDTAAEHANRTNTDTANDVTAPESEAQGKQTHGKGTSRTKGHAQGELQDRARTSRKATRHANAP
ncbi:hypothetical protein ERJ75_000493500 [Trypanosoma vivax]|nr:hypothetical protein ERJ75_000493500 [Trypanosoma vivax]